MAYSSLHITVQNQRHEPLANAMIRITQMHQDELCYEDFFMSDEQGNTREIPLFVSQDDPKNRYTIEVRLQGYEKRCVDINMLDHQTILIVLNKLTTSDQQSISTLEKKIEDLPPQTDIVLRLGSHGEAVTHLQMYLHTISLHYGSVPFISDKTVFDEEMQRSLTAFQHLLGIEESGVTNLQTWKLLKQMYIELTT